MVVRSGLDRFHLVIDVIDRTLELGYRGTRPTVDAR
jgi:phosphoketolase